MHRVPMIYVQYFSTFIRNLVPIMFSSINKYNKTFIRFFFKNREFKIPMHSIKRFKIF